jgi:hypothetical protein
MTRTSILIASAAAAVAAGLAATGGTARAEDGGPQITAGTGCAVQCVKKAAVSTTASSAKVELETTVLSVVTVWVAKQVTGNPPGTLTASQAKVVKLYLPAGATGRPRSTVSSRTRPTRSRVKATDVHGKSSTRTGTFKTLPVKTNGLGGPDTLDSGLGCSVQCITKALFTRAPPDGRVANADLKTSTDAKIQLIVGADQAFHEIVFDQTNPWLVRSWKPQIGKLLPGTTYHVVVRATDAQGRISERRGTFRTVSATALVTIQKIKIVNDGDKGKAKGELFFRYFMAGHELTSNGFYKLSSGQVVSAKAEGTSRRASSTAFGQRRREARRSVTAEECDGHIFMRTAGRVELRRRSVRPRESQRAVRRGRRQLPPLDILTGALPGWYGSGVAQPTGHDGYFVFGPGNRYVKILVLATVDLDYEWPS